MIDRLARYLKPQLIVMLVLFAGAVAGGVMLLPGDAERVAMLERDGSNERALQLLESRFAAGDRSQRTLYQLEQLHAHFGNLARSREMLELLAEARPRDLVLQRRLVSFYRDTQDTDAYLSALSRLLTRRYSEANCRELISGLRLIGHYAREREAIERCRLKGYRRAEDIVRLAELEASNGDARQATMLLRKLDDIKRLDSDRERMMLVSLLLDGGERRELVERSVRWVKDSPGTQLAGSLVGMLGRRGAHDMAIEIARDAGQLGDGLSLSVAEMMIDRDQTSAARAYLRGWLPRAALADQALIERFVTIALDAEDPELALLAGQRIGLQRLTQPQLVAIAEALGATGRTAEFETVRTQLAAETIVAHPLLAAMVELNKGAPSSSRELLNQVSADALDRWRLALWARLMRDTGSPATADAKLRELGVTAVTTASLPVIVKRRPRRAVRIAVAPTMPWEPAAAPRRPRKPHVLRVAQIKRLKVKTSRTIRHSAHRSGGIASRPSPVSRPLAQVEPRN
jgi:hypothetical protein